jgi:hypothetical protein
MHKNYYSKDLNYTSYPEVSPTNFDRCKDKELEDIMNNTGIDGITQNKAQKLLAERLISKQPYSHIIF